MTSPQPKMHVTQPGGWIISLYFGEWLNCCEQTGVSSLGACGDRGLRLPLWAETAPASSLYNSALALGAGLSWSHFRKQTRRNGEGERQSLILSKELWWVLSPPKSVWVLTWTWKRSAFGATWWGHLSARLLVPSHAAPEGSSWKVSCDGNIQRMEFAGQQWDREIVMRDSNWRDWK